MTKSRRRLDRSSLAPLLLLLHLSCSSSFLVRHQRRHCPHIMRKRSSDGDEPMDIGDVVTYSLDEALDGCKEALGVVLESADVQPLCRWSEDATEFVWDDDQEAIAPTRVVRVLDQTGVFPEQRMAPRNIDPQ